MKKRMLAAPLAVAASLSLVLAGCASTEDSSSGLQIDVPDIPMIEELGAFEDELNIVAWSGFVEPAWADTFTAETGCVVNRKVAASSDEMVQLMRTGEYDLVSASGDASLRLIVDGKVKFACVDGPEFDGHLVDFDQAMKRQQQYKTEEGRAKLAYEEGATHHGGCGNCGGDK